MDIKELEKLAEQGYITDTSLIEACKKNPELLNSIDFGNFCTQIVSPYDVYEEKKGDVVEDVVEDVVGDVVVEEKEEVKGDVVEDVVVEPTEQPVEIVVEEKEEVKEEAKTSKTKKS